MFNGISVVHLMVSIPLVLFFTVLQNFCTEIRLRYLIHSVKPIVLSSYSLCCIDLYLLAIYQFASSMPRCYYYNSFFGTAENTSVGIGNRTGT